MPHLEAHSAGRFVEYGYAFFDFLSDTRATRIAHAGAYEVFEGEVVLLEP
jgi:hypothetical protein